MDGGRFGLGLFFGWSTPFGVFVTGVCNRPRAGMAGGRFEPGPFFFEGYFLVP